MYMINQIIIELPCGRVRLGPDSRGLRLKLDPANTWVRYHESFNAFDVKHWRSMYLSHRARYHSNAHVDRVTSVALERSALQTVAKSQWLTPLSETVMLLGVLANSRFKPQFSDY